MKKILSIFMAIILLVTAIHTQLIGVFAVDPDKSIFRVIPDGIYIIESLTSQDRVLDISEGSKNQGENVLIWSSHGGAHQAFDVKYDATDGYYTIKAMHSGKYIGVERTTDGQGTQIKQYDLPIGENLKWRIIKSSAGYFQLELKSNDLRLDVLGGSSELGTKLHLWQRNETNAQRFYFHSACFRSERYSTKDPMGASVMSQDQIKDIEMSLEGDKVRLRANIVGNKKWFKYKFVWMKNDWESWGVIRALDMSDTAEWTPPAGKEDCIIFMDVEDAYGNIKSIKRYLSMEVLRDRQEAVLAEKKQRELEERLRQESQEVEQLEKTRYDAELDLSKSRQILKEIEETKKKLEAQVKESQDKENELELRKRAIQAKIEEAKRRSEEKERQKHDLQARISQIKKRENEQETSKQEKKINEEIAKEKLEIECQNTRNLEEKLEKARQQIEALRRREAKDQTASEIEKSETEKSQPIEEISESTMESLEIEPGLTTEEIGKINPEFSKYIPYIQNVVENRSSENSSVGKEILSSKDPSLETISKKLMYVCHRMKEDKSVKNVNPYPVQILAVMKLVESVLNPESGTRGSVGDIKTGEGKSLVVTLTAIILRSYDRKIDIVTPNMELATRDWKDSKQYYDLFEMTSGFLYDKAKDSEFKDAENESKESKEDYRAEYNFEVLDRDIMYTTGANMQWMYLKSAFSAENLRNREYDVCIVDEADNLLIDGASSPALISSNFPTKQAQQILEKVYQSVVVDKKDESQIKGILQEEFKESNVNEEELALMIEAAKKSEKLEKGKDYILEEDKFWGNQVQIIDSNTGFKLSSSRWHAYVHEMIEIKEKLNLHPTSVTKCAVSPMIFFGAYKNLLGVTGTIGNEKEEELFKNIYKLSTFKVPTHREVKRGVAIKVYDPEEENLNDLITKETLEEIKKGRSVLVILDSINATNEMKGKYLKDANLIQGINVQNDRRSIRNAGKSGTITVSTIAAGRGTDIKLDKESIKAGGLHVIVSKLPAEGRTLVQNIGRSARQGQPGSATVYVRAGDRFGDISKMNPSTVNLFRLQERFSEYIRRHWPWMIAKKDIYTSESEYRFGASFEEILRTDAEIIVDKFFWPKKVLSKDEYQECLDLTKNMVLNVWGSMYTHLATSENGQDMEYCNKKYDELLGAIHQWISDDCPGPEEYIGCWAKKLHKDEEIFKFLYTHQEGMTVREFLKELFKYKRLQIHAMNADYDITNFDSMLKFMPEEHQKAYAALVSEENEYRRKLEKYNSDVAAYNEREAKRERIAKENNQVYTRTVSRAVEIPSKPELHRTVEGPQRIQISEVPQEEQKGILQKIGTAVGALAGKAIDAISMQAHAAGVEPSPIFKDPEPRREYISVPPSHAPDCPMNPDNIIEMERKCPRCVLGDINDFEYRYRTGRNLPLHNHGEVYCNCGGHYGHEASGELSPEASLKRIVVSTESYRGIQRELPPSLPCPKKPEEPDWSKIGWEYFENLNVDKVIWDRWTPPMRSRYLALRYLGCDVDAAKLGCMNEEELNRLDEKLRKISYTLKHKAELAQRKQERAERAQQKARLAIRGTSGGVKVLGGTALVAGSIAAVAGTVATGGILPLVVLAGASAGVMFGTSDVIEGVGDLTSSITGQGLDQRSYNPVRDTVFGGNELIYAGAEILASAGTSAAATKVLSGTTPRLPITNVTTKVEALNIAEETRNTITSTEKFVDTGIGEAGSTLGRMPKEDGIRYREWNYEKIREISVKNPKSDSMTLGKYIHGEGGKPAPEAYTEMAKKTGDTYFDLGTKWGEIKDVYTLTDTNMFDLFNTSALDEAVASGKTIRFTHNPRLEIYKDSALADEWKYLQSKHGYTRLEPEGDYWYAIQE